MVGIVQPVFSLEDDWSLGMLVESADRGGQSVPNAADLQCFVGELMVGTHEIPSHMA